MSQQTDPIAELAQVGAEFYDRGWLLATGGNLSARVSVDPFRFVMTASGGHKGRLRRDDFLEMGIDGVPPEGRKASAETAVHLALYWRLGPGAVLHVHSPYVTLVSRRFAPDSGVRCEGYEYVKALGLWDEGASADIPIVPNHHHIPDLAAAVAEAADEVPAVLVAGHGIYAWGDTVADAQRHVEASEFLCRMVWEELRA